MKPLEEMTGLELREAVAREVMGLAANRAKVVMRYTPDGRARGYEPDPHGAYLAVGDDECLPYESDIEAAFAVVEKMREKGCREFTAGTHGADWGATFKGHVGKRWRVFNGYSDTLPLAICRAALQAVRAK